MISHKYKCIFVHIPKAAGSSINELLSSYSFESPPDYRRHNIRPWLGRADKIMKHCSKDMWDSYFKFTFSRNPWDRAVSTWKYLSKNPGSRRGRGLGEKRKGYSTFREFIDLRFKRLNRHEKWHIYPQVHHIINNDIMVDFIGRFENLQEDFNTICDKIGIPRQELPHVNKTKHKHYTEYYDDETRQIVAEKYAKDIEMFGYEFGE